MTLETRIAALAAMSVTEKKAEWRRLYGAPAPPAFGAGLLGRGIAHALQEKAAGGPDKNLRRRLEQLNAKSQKNGAKASVAVKPGTWLSRTWHGEVHQVIVLDNGFEYRGERHASLTAIARRITGAAWSGPRFFGLHSPRLSKLGVWRNDQ